MNKKMFALAALIIIASILLSACSELAGGSTVFVKNNITTIGSESCKIEKGSLATVSNYHEIYEGASEGWHSFVYLKTSSCYGMVEDDFWLQLKVEDIK